MKLGRNFRSSPKVFFVLSLKLINKVRSQKKTYSLEKYNLRKRIRKFALFDNFAEFLTHYKLKS